MSSSPITRPARRIGSDPASLRIARHVAVLFLALVTVYPFLLVVVSSLTPESDILINGFRLLPASLTTDAYRALFADFGRIAGAYRVTATVTLLGTGAGLSVSALIAYPLSLRHLRGRSMFNLFVLFPLLFSGGMVPWYIVMTRYLGLRNSLPALILPIVVAFTLTAVSRTDRDVRKTAIALGASTRQTLWTVFCESRFGVAAAVIAAFGRVVSEVGVAMILGGNVERFTRTMTTSIVLNVDMGNFALALALGIVLLGISLSINVLFQYVQGGGHD